MAHSGNRDSPNNGIPYVDMPAHMTRMPTRFITRPVRSISLMRILPVANAIALGGVATGSINASDVVSVMGTIIASGCTRIAVAKAATTGSTIETVATLDVNSVLSEMISISMRSPAAG